MAGIRTPKDKIEKDSKSQNHRTNEVPFHVHETSKVLNSFLQFLDLTRQI